MVYCANKLLVINQVHNDMSALYAPPNVESVFLDSVSIPPNKESKNI